MSIFKWTTEPTWIYVWVDVEAEPVSVSFSYTWSDQTYTVPYTQDYIITAKWAGSRSAAWWLAQWTFTLNAWDVLKIMVWQSWSVGNSWTYWFGGTANGWNYASWWWLSWVFTWSWAISASDSSRALVIGWWAWGNSAWVWWAWWWATWWTWTWSYWTAWAGWTQTWRWSWWNTWSYQFSWWNGSWTYWYWGWWWWRWWNWSIWDSSSDDDKWGWWGSGYVKSTGTNVTLTQWWWATAWMNWYVTIVSVGNESNTPTPWGCFLKWTPILMKEWCKNIEDIIEWDVVLSFNEEKWEIEYNNVVNFIEHPYDWKIVKLNWWLIEATSNHPVYTSKDKENREYKLIWDIVEWDWLYTKDWYVEVLGKEERDYDWDVYNFTVDNNHNYFVWDWILVHNTNTWAAF